MDFRFPNCNGGNLPIPSLGSAVRAPHSFMPAQALGPRVASLGMRFHASKKSPPTFRNPIFIAERGSRNRGRKSGYRIMLVRLDNGEPVSQKPFATSWLQGETPSGRPLDVQMAPDGSLPVSDDFAGGAI